MKLRLAPGAAVLTSEPEKYPEHNIARLRRRMECIRRHGSEAKAEAEAKTAAEKSRKEMEEKLKSFSVPHLSFQRAALTEFLAQMRAIFQIWIIVDRDTDPEKIKVNMEFKAVSALEMLTDTLKISDLDFTVDDNAIVIMSKKKMERQRRDASAARKRQLDRRRAIRKIRGKRIRADLRGKRLRDVVSTLGEALEVPVCPGPRAWKENALVKERTAGRRLGDLERTMRKLGIDLVVASDAVFLLAKQTPSKTARKSTPTRQ